MASISLSREEFYSFSTENFDESLVIERGGFGKVYRGTIFNGSATVLAAIKRLDPNSNQGAPEFWAEVEMLSKFWHCNLVSLFGYCNHEKEMILVYEYMPNGTLEDHLHKLGTTLSWIQRLKICIGAARGLHYLHTAKVLDFRLSKLGPNNEPSTGVNTVVKGTFGYLDPDYYATEKRTRKSDVYAFVVPEACSEFVRIIKRCLHMYPKQRPTMAEIAVSLESVTVIQEKFNNSLQTSGTTIFGRLIDMFAFPSKGDNSGVPSSSSQPDFDELETCIVESQDPTKWLHISGYENENNNGSQNIIEGARQPKYMVLADDVDMYLVVEVIPLDDNQRKCKLRQCVANDDKKITCHPNMNREIEKILHAGHSDFQLLVWISSSKTWEPEFVQIIERCLHMYPKQRPTMAEIAASLSVPSSSSHPDADELETCIAKSQDPTKWLHISNGSQNIIEGARQPKYMVPADDVDTYLVVEVIPLDDNQRKGKLGQCVANDDKKITCHPNINHEIEKILHDEHSNFQLLVWISSSETLEPTILEIKKNRCKIKLDGPNNGVVVNIKYTQITLISLFAESPREFSILGPGGVEQYLHATSTDISCSRDTIVLTMRLFIKRAVNRSIWYDEMK
ncbi:receptor-like protein kinase FERONIA [Tanacetum coccineum]|uniref:Receptor-like protein kinase FERONIA n=1 Tax=Tanacetum coccineum TaxID=301880 RepID=A0ABQ5AI62_9ASTR